MSEGKETPPDPFRNLRKLAGRVRGFIEGTDLSMDKEAMDAKKLLEDIAGHLGFLADPEKLPKILEVKTPLRELTSVRRIEGTGFEPFLTIVEHQSEGQKYNSPTITRSVFPSMISDGQVLVFVAPSVYLYEERRAGIEERVVKEMAITDENARKWVYSEMMEKRPDLYRQEEWKPASMDVFLITRKAGKLFIADLLGDEQGSSSTGIKDFWRVTIENTQKADFSDYGSFLSPQDFEAHKSNLATYGKIYVLVEGSSQRERKRAPQAQLKPASVTQGF